uniref:Uncharacterized protein n=1 Tax=Panagrolaimus sp. PS1159 TaxID=55785 RepID=A0AC35EUK8_9BILA
SPSPSLSSHSQDESNNLKNEEIQTPSSSKENIANNHDDESLADPTSHVDQSEYSDPRKSPRHDHPTSSHDDQPEPPHHDQPASHPDPPKSPQSDPPKTESSSDPNDVIPQKPPTPDNSNTSNNDEVIQHCERDPNDIEPEIKKVIIQGYTEAELENVQQQQKVDPQKTPTKAPQKPNGVAATRLATPVRSSTAMDKRTTVTAKPASVGVAKTATKPTSVGAARTTVTTKSTAASITAASKRLSTPLRPATTERKPLTTSVTKRTPSSNPRGTP